MSEELSSMSAEQSLAFAYYQMYGSDLRVSPIEGRTYLGLNTKNGDFDIVGVIPGNTFRDIIRITIQRFLTILYSPISSDGLSGSNFIRYARETDAIPLSDKIRIMKAEIMFVAMKIPQIETIVSLDTFVDEPNGRLKFAVSFRLITAEESQFEIVESV